MHINKAKASKGKWIPSIVIVLSGMQLKRFNFVMVPSAVEMLKDHSFHWMIFFYI
jgi:hypothetical protein